MTKRKIDMCIDDIAPQLKPENKLVFRNFLLCMIFPCFVSALLVFCVKINFIITVFNSVLVSCNTDLFFISSMPFSVYIILAMINWGTLVSVNDFLFAPRRLLFEKLLFSIMFICLFLFFAIIMLGIVIQPAFVFSDMSVLKTISFGFLISALVVSFVVSFPRYLQWSNE